MGKSFIRNIFAVLVAAAMTTYVLAAKAYGKHGLVAYITDWDVPSNIPYKKLDHLIYSFAEPNAKGAIVGFDGSQLKKVVKGAHAHGVGVSLAVGGWTGSKYFSTLVTPAHSPAFVKNIVNSVKQYNLDGVNLDWEYPNSVDGMSCNVKNAKDTANFHTFLQQLRKALDKAVKNKRVTISAATATAPFNGANGNPSNVAEFKNVLDFVLIMAYDMIGSWSETTGPNAPLYDPGHGIGDSGSHAVASWVNAGYPHSQIHLGVPFYGWTAKVTTNLAKTRNPYVKFHNPQVKGDKYDELSSDPCPGAKKGYVGAYQYRSLVSDGITSNKNGWQHFFEKKSQTPWAYNNRRQLFISYDDPQSAAAKAKWAKKNGLAGVMVWSLEMYGLQRPNGECPAARKALSMDEII
ncbi:glycoside hydrolase [Jimgerdemannia flammicorona]|uniref:Glycoside hydrolase n=1 Tax=Jimgerdemannia flammicorona TaxID=994334 RepID=A0A433QJT2_9FUNG|nr:glycoside hydrolase [Jimgerdemannia flammicorona]